MNGLTDYEMLMLCNIRIMAKSKPRVTKRIASEWMRANKRRRAIREAALNTVPGLRSSALRNTQEGIPKPSRKEQTP